MAYKMVRAKAYEKVIAKTVCIAFVLRWLRGSAKYYEIVKANTVCIVWAIAIAIACEMVKTKTVCTAQEFLQVLPKSRMKGLVIFK